MLAKKNKYNTLSLRIIKYRGT